MAKQRRQQIICLFMTWWSGIALTGAFAWQLAQSPAEKYIAAMDRPDRVLKVGEVIAKLELKPGDIVADIGSGSGSFSIPMAKAIAPNGILYAVDIDQAMLDHVVARAKEGGVTNLHTVLGEYDDPTLPVKNVGVAFFINDFDGDPAVANLKMVQLEAVQDTIGFSRAALASCPKLV